MSNQLPLPSNRGLPALDGMNGGAVSSRYGGQELAGPTDQGIKRYLAALLRYKWMILLIVALGTGAGFVLASRQPVLYQTRARVWIGAGLAGGMVGVPIRQGQLVQGSGWQQLLVSSAVLDTVVRREKLYLKLERPADSIAFHNFHIRNRVAAGTYSLATDASRRSFTLTDAAGQAIDRGAVGDSVGEMVGMLWVPLAETLPANRPLTFTLRSPGDVVGDLADGNRLQSTNPDNDNFMIIRLRGADRAEITKVLTAIVKRFEEVALELKQRRLTETANVLRTQLTQAERALASAEQELQAFKVTTITLPSEQGVPVNPGLQTTDPSALGNYWRLTTQKDLYDRDREAILRALESGDGVAMRMALGLVPSVNQSASLAQALSEAAGSDAKIRSLKITFTELHPTVQSEQQHLDSLEQHVIPVYARQLAQQLRSEAATTERLIDNSAGELRKIPQRAIQLGKLERVKQIADDMYRQLETQHQNAKLAEVTTVPDMQILDWPQEPFMPVADQRLRMLLMCVGGSLGLALLGAILRDRFDPRLRYPDEVTGGMGLFILGAVPALRRGKLGATDMALAVEAFRAIQLSILHAHGAEAPLMLTVTSPGASDGKSFVTSNLAIAFADMGHRTLVIDGDVRRGTVHQLMGTSHKPGLTDYLAGHARSEQIINATRYTLLDVIGCGSRGEAGPKLLGSSAMNKLIEDLREDYDIILIDSPPLGACVDPMILGTLTRNLVLVLRTGTTDRVMAESKLQILDRLPIRVLGAILNDVPARGPYRYYSYLSGYEVLPEVQVGQEVGSLPGGDGSDGGSQGKAVGGNVA